MGTLMLILSAWLLVFFDSVYGNAFPKPTPTAALEKRQAAGLTVVWSESVTDYTSTTWKRYSPVQTGGVSTVYSSGTNWGWCPSTVATCNLASVCLSGTLTYPGGSTRTCEATAPLCGTELLYSSIGATTRQTRNACFSTSDVARLTRSYLLTPPLSESSTTSASSSITSNSIIDPAPSPSRPQPTHKGTPVGAIVGGVVGGLAVLAIAIIGIVFFLTRRRSSEDQRVGVADTNLPGHGQAVVVDGMTQAGTHTSYYDSKHTSYASTYPSAPPPPQYPTPETPVQQVYFQTTHNGAPDSSPYQVSSVTSSPPSGYSNDQAFISPASHHGPLHEAHELPSHTQINPATQPLQ